MFRNSKQRKIVTSLSLGLALGVTGYVGFFGPLQSDLDNRVLDYFFRRASPAGNTVRDTRQVVYLTITDETYRRIGTRTRNRHFLARLSEALAALRVEAVAYDMIFARPGAPADDAAFVRSIRRLGAAYLPVGFSLSDTPVAFKWEEGAAGERLRRQLDRQPEQHGTPQPLYARRAMLQLDELALAAAGAGHISAANDDDGIYRHAAMVVMLDSLLYPSLSLAMFLDYANVPFEHISVRWGKEIRIPALPGSFLAEDIRIPIDSRGRTAIPFRAPWGRDFRQMTAHTLLERMAVDSLRGNLAAFFEGCFVFIGEASTGIADLGSTPLERDVPLVAIHASLMNALLANTFYWPWPKSRMLLCIGGICLLFWLAGCCRRALVLYLAGLVVLAGLLLLTRAEFQHFALLPLATVLRAAGLVFFGQIAGLQLAIARDRAFIRGAFSKYVPERVVSELLAHPERLQLGGEEREMSVMFCDLAGFTSLSEGLPPQELVRLLNDFFSEMTKVILAHGGLIDKYLGDAIMAEFGAPLAQPDHADRAVAAALAMQKALRRLNEKVCSPQQPALHARVGINSGPMVIGNIGSRHTFDYTVIGDAVNLAARLESANRYYGTALMISEYTHAALAPGTFHSRLLDVIRVKGKAHALRVFEVYAARGERISQQDRAYNAAYARGMRAYLAREFASARKWFSAALHVRPRDPASAGMLERLETFGQKPLAEEWDGAVALIDK